MLPRTTATTATTAVPLRRVALLVALFAGAMLLNGLASGVAMFRFPKGAGCVPGRHAGDGLGAPCLPDVLLEATAYLPQTGRALKLPTIVGAVGCGGFFFVFFVCLVWPFRSARMPAMSWGGID